MSAVEKVDVKKLLKKIAESVVQSQGRDKKPTKSERIAEWKGSLETLPIEKVLALDLQMKEFCDKNFASVELNEPREISAQEAELLAQELIAARGILEALEGVNARAKSIVFGHLDTIGVTNGSVEVPSLGVKFMRTSKGSGDPRIDWDRMKNLMPEVYDQVVSTKEVTTTVTEINWDKLAELITFDSTVEEGIKDVVIPGKEVAGSFYFKEISKG